MALMRRFNSQTVRLTGSPVASGDTIVWRAPYDCRVTHIRALRTGGASAVVNGKIGSTNILSANVTAGNGTYATGATNQTQASGVGSGVMNAGDVLTATVVSGDATMVLWQADIEVDADVQET